MKYYEIIWDYNILQYGICGIRPISAQDSHLAWPWRTRTRSTRGTKGMVQNSKTGQHAPAPTSQLIPAAEMENHGKPMKLWRCETGLNHVWLSQPGWDDFRFVTL